MNNAVCKCAVAMLELLRSASCCEWTRVRDTGIGAVRKSVFPEAFNERYLGLPTTVGRITSGTFDHTCDTASLCWPGIFSEIGHSGNSAVPYEYVPVNKRGL